MRTVILAVDRLRTPAYAEVVDDYVGRVSRLMSVGVQEAQEVDELARFTVVEQAYRALTVLRNHPHHREG
jgi:23S rRNA pseudoU1915 N3-methylase RlmH